MGRDDRRGARRDRTLKMSSRVPKLGYYFVVTDTRETEINYLHGFRDSIPHDLRDRLVIKVNKAPTNELIEKCLEMVSAEPQYRKPWIVFDRDQVKDFDSIIADAERNSVNVGWSNPCIEIWFSAYWGAMPTYQTSVQCNKGFEKAFKDKTNQVYDKAATDNYNKLCRFGDEGNTVRIAETRYAQRSENCNSKPSEMLSTTTLHHLIGEIRGKIKKSNTAEKNTTINT